MSAGQQLGPFDRPARPDHPQSAGRPTELVRRRHHGDRPAVGGDVVELARGHTRVHRHRDRAGPQRRHVGGAVQAGVGVARQQQHPLAVSDADLEQSPCRRVGRGVPLAVGEGGAAVDPQRGPVGIRGGRPRQ
jgi:hypothetical protein